MTVNLENKIASWEISINITVLFRDLFCNEFKIFFLLFYWVISKCYFLRNDNI